MEFGEDRFLIKPGNVIYPQSSTPLIKRAQSFESGYSTGLSSTPGSVFDQSLPNSTKYSKNYSISEDEDQCLSSPVTPKQDIVLFRSPHNPSIPLITLTPVVQEVKSDESVLNDKTQDKPSSMFLTVTLPKEGLYPPKRDLFILINRSCPLVTSWILSYLEPSDLIALCITSKAHHEIVINEKSANERRLNYLAKIKNLKNEMGQENWPLKKPLDQRESRGILVNVQNLECQVKEADNLDESKKLVKEDQKRKVTVKKRKDIFTIIETELNLNRAFQESKKMARKQRLEELIEERTVACKKSKIQKESGVGSLSSKRNLRRL